MRQRDFWLFVKGNGASRMKRNGVPHQLDLMCRYATFFQKRARRVGPIHLEALLCGVVVGYSQIVQNRRDRQELWIWSRFRRFRNQYAKKPRAHRVVEKVRL